MFDTFLKAILIDLAFYQSIGLLILVITLSSLISIPRQQQPLYFFIELAKKFASKVNRNQRSAKQRAIAGTLTGLFLVFPTWFIIAFLVELAAYPLFFEILILFLCLSDNGLQRESKQIAALIHEGNKTEAKNKLSKWCQRDITPLSDVGLVKACIEKMAQISSVTNGLVIFSFLLGGVDAVLLVTLIKQLDYAWPHSDQYYRPFNAFTFILNKITSAIPYSIYLFLFAIRSPKTISRLVYSALNKPKNTLDSIIAELIAAKLDIELGGARMYRGKKQSTPKYKYGAFPGAHHILKAQHQFGTMNVLLIAGLMVYLFIHFVSSIKSI